MLVNGCQVRRAVTRRPAILRLQDHIVLCGDIFCHWVEPECVVCLRSAVREYQEGITLTTRVVRRECRDALQLDTFFRSPVHDFRLAQINISELRVALGGDLLQLSVLQWRRCWSDQDHRRPQPARPGHPRKGLPLASQSWYRSASATAS